MGVYRERERERLEEQRGALERELQGTCAEISPGERAKELQREIAELHRRIVAIDEEEQDLSNWFSEGGR